MTELETMQRAKMYIDKMANGINPLTDKAADEDDMINNVRISRCLFYVSSVLDKVIKDESKAERKVKTAKDPFTIDEDMLKNYDFTEEPITISVITKKINSLNNSDQMKKIKPQDITNWLVYTGVLYNKPDMQGKINKHPTEKGELLGIVSDERDGKYGRYMAVHYNKESEKFIIEHLFEIIEFIKNDKNERGFEYQGKPWTQQHEECLLDLYSKNVPINEIAVTLKRNVNSIVDRLKKLGKVPR